MSLQATTYATTNRCTHKDNTLYNNILNEEPVTHIFSLSVDRERPAVTYVVDEQGYEFLWKLIGSIVVRAVGHDCRHAVGVVERAYEMV